MLRMSPLTYKDAGVDIDAGDEFVKSIKTDIASTKQPWVLSDIGLFAGMIDLKMACEEFKEPVLVQVLNGISCNTVGYDELSYNSLGCQVVCGCLKKLSSVKFKPISFLDYIGISRLMPEIHGRIINGMVDRFEDKVYCNTKIPIIGGETAEMPVIYRNNCVIVVGVLTDVTEAEDIKKIDQRYQGTRTLPLSPIFEVYKRPVLVQSIDGLGTKSKEQKFLGDSMRDLLSHSKNDIAVHGARPQFALTYIDANSRSRWNVFKKSTSLLVPYNLVFKKHPGIFQRGQDEEYRCINGKRKIGIFKR